MSFELVDSWRCGACQRLRERQEAEAVRRLCGAFRASTIDAQEQAAGRALRVFAALVPAGGRVWKLARRSADRDANFEPSARKMTDARRSHLMHSMIQGFILSDSQKGSAPMRRGFRA